MIASKKGNAIVGIQTRDKIAELKVSGHLIGDFIVYKSVAWNLDTEQMDILNNWTVSHVPTGRAIFIGVKKLDTAKEYAAHLDTIFPKYGWTFNLNFTQNMFVTPEITRKLSEYVTPIREKLYKELNIG